MNEAEEALFASDIYDADSLAKSVELVKARDERIRRDAHNAAMEEVIKVTEEAVRRHANIDWGKCALAMELAQTFRAFKVAP